MAAVVPVVAKTVPLVKPFPLLLLRVAVRSPARAVRFEAPSPRLSDWPLSQPQLSGTPAAPSFPALLPLSPKSRRPGKRRSIRYLTGYAQQGSSHLPKATCFPPAEVLRRRRV